MMNNKGLSENRISGDSLTMYDTFDNYSEDSSSTSIDTDQINNNNKNDDSNNNNKNRLIKLALIAMTTPGVKFFKSAQSSFQEYLMNDERIRMSATTYGFMLTLISMPIVPLVGGALLDCNHHHHAPTNHNNNGGSDDDDDVDDNDNKEEEDDDDDDEERPMTPLTRYNSGNLVMSLRSITTTSGTTTTTSRSIRNHNDNTTTTNSKSNSSELLQKTRNNNNNNNYTTAMAASQSYSLVGFLALCVLGIIVYGIGLASSSSSSLLLPNNDDNNWSIPIGLAGATIFGIGEGCVMVAARAFVGHIFLGGDGAFAQGVLIAANNLSMMASKNLVPWLIETTTTVTTTTTTSIEKQQQQQHDSYETGVVYSNNDDNNDSDDNHNVNTSIRIGVVACVVVQLAGLLAGIFYMRVCLREHHQQQQQRQKQGHKNKDGEQQSLLLSKDERMKEHSRSASSMRRDINEMKSGTIIVDDNGDKDDKQRCCHSGGVRRRVGTVMNLPLTFWIVAVGRAIFLVTFKVFSRYSNSFLIEKLHMNAVKAGRLSSVNEFFALFSPLVGFLAYRSPGGIVGVAIGAALLGMSSIGLLALLPAAGIRELPGGLVSPLIGISIAHGILIPISLAMIPHTVTSPHHLGMAFAVVEVLGNTLNLTDIVFGWLRDVSGNYDAPMKLLLVYAGCGTILLVLSRKRIGAIGMMSSSSSSSLQR